MAKTDEEVMDMMFGKDRPKYLGATPVRLDDHPLYSGYTPKDWALLWIERYGQIETTRSKTWVLDQVARILTGCTILAELAKWDNGNCEMRFTIAKDTSAEYKNWVEKMLGDTDEHGDREYDYDDGTN